MNTTIFAATRTTALALSLAVAGLFAGPVAAAGGPDDARLARVTAEDAIAAAAAGRGVEWACNKVGAPSFGAMAQLGYANDSRLYRQRLALVTLIRNTCARHDENTLLVLVPAGDETVEAVAVR